MPKWIGIYRKTDRASHVPPDATSLQVGPYSLGVVGVLPHGAKIWPRTIRDADQLIQWLEKWKTRVQEEASK